MASYKHSMMINLLTTHPNAAAVLPCQSESIEELYMSRTNLTGQLPDVIPPDSQLRLWYSMNTMDSGSDKWPGGGFSGG